MKHWLQWMTRLASPTVLPAAPVAPAAGFCPNPSEFSNELISQLGTLLWSEPPVRTTIAAAGGIPGKSLVEIDCIAHK